jgi:hypothetical protein
VEECPGLQESGHMAFEKVTLAKQLIATVCTAIRASTGIRWQQGSR